MAKKSEAPIGTPLPESELARKIILEDLTGPQACIVAEMCDFAKEYHALNDNLGATVKRRAAKIKKKDRFTLPAYTHRITMQRARDCLRFRVWFPDRKDGPTNRFIEVSSLKKAAQVILTLAAEGICVEQRVVGVVWDNNTVAFAECLVKEWEENYEKKENGTKTA